ncbi:hypothetical protein FTO70_03885 [Methanosarcina sp. KYL-1]|uniref:hypothetical protein n=1 Tax=Methanosarcina sp. KYL-1 TaxID=2602068 RepID=UPI002100E247|nr:hypothetical protein [Methanosarcina sp. KYL-1]MCQ1534844.1 hypothetical protein [Methanosarcina sp. KYL-1]
MAGWNDYNRTEAFQSLDNLRENFSYQYNISDYPAIQNMTNASAADDPAAAANSILTPVNSFWASPSLYGSWFYVVLIIITVGIIYVKSQSLHRTCIAMLFMSLLAVAPEAVGVIYIPYQALYMLYVFTAVSLTGVLYTFWVGD